VTPARARRWLAWSAALALSIAATPANAAHKVFVTSVTGSGDLSTWPDAGSNAGLAAGDAICQARATAANLANPDQYVAWLSDDANDAYCRVTGFSGKRSANCGQPSRPTTGGPWVRFDKFPFSPSLTALTSQHVVYAPIVFDENGDPAPRTTFTGTNEDGTSDFESPQENCQGWTSSSAAVSTTAGDALRSSGSWTSSASPTCSEAESLICIQKGSGNPLPPFDNPGVPAFVSESGGGGNLSTRSGANGQTGLAAADAVCQSEAAEHGIWGAQFFRAWLSDSTTSAIDRITGNGPWVRLDGVEIAASKSDLTGALIAPLNVSSTGFYFGNDATWTGSTPAGLSGAATCADWTSSSSSDLGQIGTVNFAASGWGGSAGGVECDAGFSLYCFCDQTLIFGDGVERGDLTAWTSHLP